LQQPSLQNHPLRLLLLPLLLLLVPLLFQVLALLLATIPPLPPSLSCLHLRPAG
jgi:hypothetical protein